MAAESRRLVILAMLANFLIAVTKFIAAGISGSSAMLSEGIHSLADTGNQIFLLRGHAVSAREPDVQHPYGRGKELYFWAFMVAVVLFVGGSVLSIISGIDRIRNPEGSGEGGFWLSMGVLAIAALFEASIAFRPAVRQFNAGRSGRSVIRAIRESKDPSLVVVLFEDAAALVGVGIAAIGLILARVTGDGVWDGLASVLIGVLLAGVAWFIATEMKSLLIGEAATREERSRIRAATLGVDEVQRIDRLLTMQLGPEEILVNMDVAFDDGLDTDQMEAVIKHIEAVIEESVPSARKVFIEPVDT
ncbi:MAG: cation diffusion facilitator family transporter [Acidimicrobiia bacterium]|nr:MAG: cation diffusion facilitator family transporter [Acidimicrobiia bacterium]